MKQIACLLIASMALAGVAFAQSPRPELIQGLYEGISKDASGQKQIEARLVATGKGTFKLLVRQNAADGKVNKVELTGKLAGDKLDLASKPGDAQWTGSLADSTIKGKIGADGSFELKRIVRESPTLGAKPPAGATVLIDGKNFDEMTCRPNPDGSAQWKVVEEGAIQVPKGGMNSKRPIDYSFKLHVEFKIPFMPEATGQGRGNSGCYLPNGDEIQVLDSFGMTTYEGGGCGGLYRYKDPDAFDEFSLASAPPLQWQTYDIEYRVEKKDGKLVGKPRVTVYHNGIKIHDNYELRRDARAGTFQFQDHGNPVQYRNIWVAPLEK